MKPCFMTEVQKIKQEILREIKSKIDGFNRRYNEVAEKLGVLDEHIVHAKEVIDGIHEHNDTAVRAAEAAQESANLAVSVSEAAQRTAQNAAAVVENGKAAVDAQAEIQKQAIASNAAAHNAAIEAKANAERASLEVTGAAQNAAIEAKGQATLDSIPADYTAVANAIPKKADVIIDFSERAAAHTLHAQDGRMNVTLYGKTTETGSGDKSPDNPYVISGVDVARVHACGKNLLSTNEYVDHTRTQLINTLCAELNALNFVENKQYTLSLVSAYPSSGPNSNHNLYVVFTYTDGTKSSTSAGRFYDEARSGVGNFSVTSGAGKTISSVTIGGTSSSTKCTLSNVQFEIGSTATPYEPYNANVITPPLLPDGSPLMGNGTVDDTIENDVLVGCDKGIWLTGASTENWTKSASGVFGLALNDYNTGNLAYSSTHYTTHSTPITGNQMYWMNTYYGNRIGFASTLATVEEWRAHLAANPIYLAYRSTAYTPDKTLRVCKVTRNVKTFRLVDRTWNLAGTNSAGMKVFYSSISSAPPINKEQAICNVLPISNNYQSNTPCAYVGTDYSGRAWVVAPATITSGSELKEWLTDEAAIVYHRATPETYMIESLPLRKPDGIMPVTVTGSAETAVTYPHDTKHYIDEKFDALAAALLS